MVEAFKVVIECSALRFEILEMFEFDGQSGLKRSFEIETELGEPLPVFLGPGGFSLAVDEAVITKSS